MASYLGAYLHFPFVPRRNATASPRCRTFSADSSVVITLAMLPYMRSVSSAGMP